MRYICTCVNGVCTPTLLSCLSGCLVNSFHMREAVTPSYTMPTSEKVCPRVRLSHYAGLCNVWFHFGAVRSSWSSESWVHPDTFPVTWVYFWWHIIFLVLKNMFRKVCGQAQKRVSLFLTSAVARYAAIYTCTYIYLCIYMCVCEWTGFVQNDGIFAELHVFWSHVCR